jgi:indolepyruvate ferredoxin oxidoreductase, beta subunit
MNKEQINIVICGIGGQGVVLAARTIAEACLLEGMKVLTADVPPISQRFAPTLCFARLGEGVYSETIPEGEADLLIGFEPLQALKHGLAFASEDGYVLINNRPIDLRANPSIRYPEVRETGDYFKQMGIKNVRCFDASDVAIQKTGSLLALNMVMLGAAYATGIIKVEEKNMEAAIQKVSPKRAVEKNRIAFKAGIDLGAKKERDPKEPISPKKDSFGKR